jgi:hypothetical protein
LDFDDQLGALSPRLELLDLARLVSDPAVALVDLGAALLGRQRRQLALLHLAPPPRQVRRIEPLTAQ